MTNWVTTHCPVEISPKCPGHQGWEKFRDCLTGALLFAPDTETGTVDWEVWAGLIIQADSVTIESDTCPVTIPADTYQVITTNDHGHVHVHTYETAQAAQDAFDAIESAYGDWLSGNDHDEYAITSSTGRIGA